jgi:ABC-2 type transport system ATP-binding protein
MGDILKIDGLSKDFGPVRAVDQVSFSIGEGEIVGLLGPNGAGKSTTINMILGILEPSAGRVEMLGKDLAKHRSELADRMNFSAVYAYLPHNLTVRQNLEVFGRLYSVAGLDKRVSDLLAEFDLADFSGTKTGLLSSGESSRLSLAKALMNSPRLLLLDEPTASLDPSVAQHIRARIRDYTDKSRAGVLWTSHNMREIEQVCDRVLFLSHGRILLDGDPRRLPGEHGAKDLEDLFITIAREPLSHNNI